MFDGHQIAAEKLEPTLGFLEFAPREVALDYLESRPQALHLRLEHQLVALPALRSLFEIRGVVTPIRFEVPRVHLPDRVHDTVEKISIVARDDHCTAPGSKRVLQPLDRLDVEVVGRLVQNQDIR